MKNVLFIKILLLLALYTSSSFAASAYLYCNKINGLKVESRWLKDENNNYIEITGQFLYSKQSSGAYIFKADKSLVELKSECARGFGDTTYKNIQATIKSSYFSDQIPITDSNSELPIFENKLEQKHISDILDYNFILALAYASHYAYRTEIGKHDKDIDKNKYNLDYVKSRTGFKYVKKSKIISEKANVHSVAFVNKNQKIVIIAYKGTSNNTDLYIDAQLFVANTKTFSFINIAINEAIKNYNDTMKIVNKKYKGYSVVLTGHSLGAFYATMVSANKYIPARVFSSPATQTNSTTHSMAEYLNMYSYFPIYNVINFVRYSDPVNFASGRHIENRIYFNASHTYNGLKNHSLIGMINDLFEKEEAPYFLYLNSNYGNEISQDQSYFGIKKIIQYSGYTPNRMLSNLSEKQLLLYNNSFDSYEDDDFIVVDHK